MVNGGTQPVANLLMPTSWNCSMLLSRKLTIYTVSLVVSCLGGDLSDAHTHSEGYSTAYSKIQHAAAKSTLHEFLATLKDIGESPGCSV